MIYFVKREGCTPATLLNSDVAGTKFAQYDPIIADERFQIRMAILQSVTKCKGYE